MSDQQQTLRLLATLREEIAAVRARQEELYEVLISYKDQVQDLRSTVVEKLEGLPKSPYIAGQLVPAPDNIGGVDDFRQLLSTYLHQAPPGAEDPAPRDVVMDPPEEVKPEASFVDDLGADSLDQVELVMALEEEFNIEISDEEAESIKTVQDTLKYVTGHAAKS